MNYFFDRICFPEKTGTQVANLGPRALIESVTKEILRITSQKQYFEGFQRYKPSGADVLGFGVSSAIGDTVNSYTARNLATEIKSVLLAFEPRLLKPIVRCRMSESRQGQLVFEISGHLLMDGDAIRYNKYFDLNEAY